MRIWLNRQVLEALVSYPASVRVTNRKENDYTFLLDANTEPEYAVFFSTR